MDDSYRLLPADHQRIYKEEIEPAFFAQTQPVAQPKLVVIAGQTGAGKSKIVSKTTQEMGYNVLPVSTDAMRNFHPQHDEIVNSDDKLAAERTQPDASEWANVLLRNAIATRRNIILEGVFRNGSRMASIIELAKSNGYFVTVRFVAAHERFSVWGIIVRYEREKVRSRYGRYAPIAYHDECYRSLLDTANRVQRQQRADAIEVFSREGVRLYSNRLMRHSWEHSGAVAQAIETERSRGLSQPEQIAYTKGWHEVFQLMKKRRASPEEIDEVEQLEKRYAQ
jgi:UDP-N-acetylglucosamine kinase